MSQTISRDIAIACTLYHPSSKQLVRLIENFGDKFFIYLIDNTPEPSSELLELAKSKNNIFVYSERKNLGLSRAFNYAAHQAAERNFKYLLMLDQDSEPSVEIINGLFSIAEENPIAGMIGPVVSSYITEAEALPPVSLVQYIITSGTLLRLSVFKLCGDFDEKLFIDCVDTEYCLRLELSGHAILRANHLRMLHRLGNMNNHKIASVKITASHHNYLRRYYITRNLLYTAEKYRHKFPEFMHLARYMLADQFIKVVLAEKQKIKKLVSMYRGWRDFRNGKMGAHPDSQL